jgi:hypothetical protein
MFSSFFGSYVVTGVYAKVGNGYLILIGKSEQGRLIGRSNSD